MSSLNKLVQMALGLAPVAGQAIVEIKKSVKEKNEKAKWLDEINSLISDKGQYGKAIELGEKHLNDEDPYDVIIAQFYIGVAYYLIAYDVYQENKYSDEIEAITDKALYNLNQSANYLENTGRNDDILARSYFFICWCKYIRQHFKEIAEARRLCIRVMGMDPSSTESIYSDLRELYNNLTDYLMLGFNNYLTIDEDNRELRQLLENDNYPKEEIDKEIEQQLVLAEKAKFSNRYSLGERQFLFIVQNEDKIAGCVDDSSIIEWVFTIGKMPKDIVFPVGHPQPNTLYIAHPAQKGMYLPYEGAEEKLFHEKVDEFIRLAQGLGAKEISYRSLKGESVSDNFSSNLNVDGNIGVKSIDVNGSYSQRQNTSSQSNNNKEEVISYRYKPNSKPYVPEDLIWLETDNSWKNFVKQRLEGNTLYFTKKITSEEAINVSNSLALGVKAAFNYLMVNVNGNYDKNTDTTFSHNQNTEWEIKIEFASIDEIEASNMNGCNDNPNLCKPITLTENEEKYREEVLFILEDGLITETERKLLERKRVKLGLSIERAAEIEAMCVPSLTEDEKEYLEIYKEFIEDGPITDRKRKMLSREAESLGISPERVEELEKQV